MNQAVTEVALLVRKSLYTRNHTIQQKQTTGLKNESGGHRNGAVKIVVKVEKKA